MRANLSLGLVGSVLTLVVIFEMLRRRRLREKYAIFWVAIATFTLLIAAFPGFLTWLSDLAGVAIPTNLLFFLASMVLLLITMQLSHDLGRLEERARRLAEEVALLRLELPPVSDEPLPRDE